MAAHQDSPLSWVVDGLVGDKFGIGASCRLYNSALALAELAFASAVAFFAAELAAEAALPPLLDASLLALEADFEATEERLEADLLATELALDADELATMAALDAEALATDAAELRLDFASLEAMPMLFKAQS